MRDFSLSAYCQLLEALKAQPYIFYRFADQPFLQNSHQYHVMLRHDVDRLPSRALRMAELETEMGVVSTYFFRTKSVSFNKGIIASIQQMGHEVGYHYECLSDTRGDIDKAWQLFQKELDKFADLCEIKSIAMHGRPLLPYDNRDIWNHYDYRDCSILQEAYRDIPWSRYIYLTDVGSRWDSDKNLRDHAPDEDAQIGGIRTTSDLIGSLDNMNKNLIISTHPERWPNSPVGWLQARLFDRAVDGAKVILMKTRRLQNRTD